MVGGEEDGSDGVQGICGGTSCFHGEPRADGGAAGCIGDDVEDRAELFEARVAARAQAVEPDLRVVGELGDDKLVIGVGLRQLEGDVR